MKVKEAIVHLMGIEEKDLYKSMVQLYRDESEARIKLRAHDAKPTQGLVDSIMSEMEHWITQVARGVGLEDETLKTLLGERGVLYAKYRMIDPVAAKQLLKMRHAYQRGQAPIEVLTTEGLEAIGNMMVGQMVQSAREATEKMYPDRPLCPHGVKARFCEKQESFSREIPQSVEDVQFYCKIDPEKCDWKR